MIDAGTAGSADTGIPAHSRAAAAAQPHVTDLRFTLLGTGTSSGIPVIADMDAGYGNALNVIRSVREYEKTGVAAFHPDEGRYGNADTLRPLSLRFLAPHARQRQILAHAGERASDLGGEAGKGGQNSSLPFSGQAGPREAQESIPASAQLDVHQFAAR